MILYLLYVLEIENFETRLIYKKVLHLYIIF